MEGNQNELNIPKVFNRLLKMKKNMGFKEHIFKRVYNTMARQIFHNCLGKERKDIKYCIFT
jgi:hypothetical protein